MKGLARWRRAIPLAAPALIVGLVIGAPSAAAAEFTVAVASNFKPAAERLAAAFERESGHRVRLSFGSTGMFYAQIRNGAPFDVFFAADVERPRKLAEAGIAVEGSRFTYARGELVLWGTKPLSVVGGGDTLRQGGYRHIALANPELAPYGLAAKQALLRLGLWEPLRRDGRLVMGQNIGQTHQMVASGSVPLGFVALSQIRRPGREVEGSYWVVPAELHEPILQQAVLLRDTPAARAFLEFVHGDAGRRIIESYGYAVPAAAD